MQTKARIKRRIHRNGCVLELHEGYPRLGHAYARGTNKLLACRLLAYILTVSASFYGSFARADDAMIGHLGRPRMSLPVYVEVHLAIVHAEDMSWAPGLGGSAGVLFGPLSVGVGLDVETLLIGYTRLGAALHAGVLARLGDLELDAAGLLGIAYMHTGEAILGENPGAGGSIGFTGARGGLRYVLKTLYDGRILLSLGIGFSYEHDLNPYTIDYKYTEQNWLFDNDEHLATDSVRIGTDRVAFMLSLSSSFE
jgi:hypothetical protein